MSFEDITIYRDMPIIDDRVVKAPNNAVDFIATGSITNADAVITRLSLGSGKQTGSKFGAQEFVRLIGVAPDEWYATDPLAGL